MGKKKLIRFEKNRQSSCLIQMNALELLNADYHLKGRWAQTKFANSNPIVLELGCGKGEYTVSLARQFSQKNYIGMDIKGSRLFFGATCIEEEKLANACFIRGSIEQINRIFAREINEIWITFPDPLPTKARQRLTSPRFLNAYREILKDNAVVHLKTDSHELFDFTRTIAYENSLEIITETENLYASECRQNYPDIKTAYEQRYLDEGKKICLLTFRLNQPVAPLKNKND